MFFMVSSDCKKVQHLISTKRNYYTGVHSSKKALKIYCPSIQGSTRDKTSSWALSHPLLAQSAIPKGFKFFCGFFWQSLISPSDAAELYNFGQRQVCDDSVTWQWGRGQWGFKDECGCVSWVFKCHQNFACGCREVPHATLCDPGVQSHALDVSSLLLRFVRRPEELRRGAEVGRHGPAGGTDASCGTATSASRAGIIAIAAFKGAGVAAYAVRRRAAGRGLQTQQGAGVLWRCGQDGSSWGRGRRGGGWRRARGAAIPARRDGLRLDAHAGVCVDGQHGALRYMGHRPENRVTEDREGKKKEDKGQNKEERQEKKNIQKISDLTKGVRETGRSLAPRQKPTLQGTAPTGKSHTPLSNNPINSEPSKQK